MKTQLTRPELDSLPSYLPSPIPLDSSGAPQVNNAARLALNELPFGPLPGVLDAIIAAAGDTNRYPDMAALALRKALADRHGLTPDRIVTGFGSVYLLELLLKAVCAPGQEFVFSQRSYEAYPVVAVGGSLRPVAVPCTDDFRQDLDAMAAAITADTRVALICNPNNPTGTAVTRAELTKFIDSVPESVLVVMDEAYGEFVTDPEVPDGLVEYSDRRNVVVLRTMSKAWGLAGLRLGWLAAAPEVAEAMRKLLAPFATSTIAEAAALAAFGQEDEVRRRVDCITAERARMFPALKEFAPRTPESHANFFWLPMEDPAAFAAHCAAAGVLIRDFPEAARVTVGNPAENDRLLAIIATADRLLEAG
ncbi:histidinol-phosphate aminotransferase [Streptomyces sp. 3211.6]|uniref:histidinol-phosphate transaminase n=1 Tax=Streptomyces TaxID=1883 RepID=UPI000CBF3CF3|nr:MULTISPECIES: histidinol-phosphate transaminase [Streptomyces]RKT05894.1 histidinol-phosphate aminotransferase [Streptomyces sp. 3211.6]RPF41848.1 histidinol-phosphate aminotransferase [Streptomyces sp. Ag109_G2-6]